MSRDHWAYAQFRILRNLSIRLVKRIPRVHRTAYVHRSARVSRDLIAAEFAFVGRRCSLDPGVRIGRYTMLASEVAVLGDDHLWNFVGVPIQFSGRPQQTDTIIEQDVWVGYRALVMRGVRIGRGAVVAAHAVVTSDVSPYTVVAGVPARRIADRFSGELDCRRHDEMLVGEIIRPRFVGPLASGSGRVSSST